MQGGLRGLRLVQTGGVVENLLTVWYLAGRVQCGSVIKRKNGTAIRVADVSFRQDNERGSCQPQRQHRRKPHTLKIRFKTLFKPRLIIPPPF
jgi:hypothetical protein